MNEMKARAIQILLVEDSPSDAKLTIRAMKSAKIANEIRHVTDGVRALEFLRQQGEYAMAPRPDLILLDLNLPRKNGQEVLKELRNDPKLTTIPVVVLTTSHQEEDIVRSYQLHANCYVTKPVDFQKFLYIVKTIENFWLSVVELPPKTTDEEQ
jgi:two-component system response regulator